MCSVVPADMYAEDDGPVYNGTSEIAYGRYSLRKSISAYFDVELPMTFRTQTLTSEVSANSGTTCPVQRSRAGSYSYTRMSGCISRRVT